MAGLFSTLFGTTYQSELPSVDKGRSRKDRGVADAAVTKRDVLR